MHSDVSEKRLQREDVLRDTEEALAASESSRAAGTAGAFVNVLMLDHLLEGRLLSAEMWARFPEAAGRLRIFAPNLRAMWSPNWRRFPVCHGAAPSVVRAACATFSRVGSLSLWPPAGSPWYSRTCMTGRWSAFELTDEKNG